LNLANSVLKVLKTIKTD